MHACSQQYALHSQPSRYMRVYQGTLKRGDFVTFGAQRSKLKV